MQEDTAKFIESLSPELRKKAMNCKNPEEILAIAHSHDLALPDEVLEKIAGGTGESNSGCGGSLTCPSCGSDDTILYGTEAPAPYRLKCCHCNKETPIARDDPRVIKR